MHYLGSVFVDEPTVEAVESAMESHHRWDFFNSDGAMVTINLETAIQILLTHDRKV
jgi:hypothetical protein